jgi:hypothetical protein
MMRKTEHQLRGPASFGAALLLATALTVQAKGPNSSHADEELDNGFAVEYSYSCLSGGCHEIDQALVDDYSQSYMTHVMVKCNACHGTHTAETVGEEKPNLTGYYPGIGPTGYEVGVDRCLVCHSAVEQSGGHPASTEDCMRCHLPHRFAVGRGDR